MTPDDFKTIAQGVQAAVTAIGLCAGGLWALRRYVFHRESVPKLELRVDVEFVGRQKGEWLVELLGLLKNKGNVPHKIRDLRFELRYLRRDDGLADGGADIQRQVKFAELAKEGSWTPGDQDESMTLLPGIAIRYNHLAKIPADVAFVLLHGRLKYHHLGIEDLRADRALCVPTEENASRRERELRYPQEEEAEGS